MMIVPTSFLLLLILMCSSSSFAFVLHQKRERSHQWDVPSSSSRLCEQRQRQRSDPEKELDALEEARQSLESILQQSVVWSRNQQQLLTATSRKRRELEIGLLSSLEYSDDAIDTLMEVWLHEHDGGQALVDMERSIQGNEEDTLRSLIYSHPEWSEPPCRLALLLFVQGRFAECQTYVSRTLSIKPWHFEGCQLQLLLYLVKRDYSRALDTARRAVLPPLESPRRRKQWVRRSVHTAMQQLDTLETETMQQRLEPKTTSPTAWQ